MHPSSPRTVVRSLEDDRRRARYRHRRTHDSARAAGPGRREPGEHRHSPARTRHDPATGAARPGEGRGTTRPESTQPSKQRSTTRPESTQHGTTTAPIELWWAPGTFSAHRVLSERHLCTVGGWGSVAASHARRRIAASSGAPSRRWGAAKRTAGRRVPGGSISASPNTGDAVCGDRLHTQGEGISAADGAVCRCRRFRWLAGRRRFGWCYFRRRSAECGWD